MTSGGPPKDHYSYTHYADPETARRFDDRRFGGPIGILVADIQGQVLTNCVGRVKGRTILDVGTGTGRAALLMARGGAKVTAVDASEQMLAVARRRAEDQHITVNFCLGDAHALDFRDRSFEVVISLRLLMHTPRWRDCIAELCRVSSQTVIFDYPSSRSLAALQSAWRRFLSSFGARTEAYRVFSHAEIAEALASAGFEVRSRHRLFVLPIALHKLIGSQRLTVFVEDVLDSLGLKRLLGSPVTLVAQRCRPS